MRIWKRKIPLEWVERVLFYPVAVKTDPKDASLIHAFAPIMEYHDRILHVVYIHAVEPKRVVTAFFDHKKDLSHENRIR